MRCSLVHTTFILLRASGCPSMMMHETMSELLTSPVTSSFSVHNPAHITHIRVPTYLHEQIDLFTTPPLRTQKNGPTKLNMCTRVVVRLGGCLLGWSVGGCAPVNALRTDRYSSVYSYLLWSPVKRNQLSLATKSLIGEWGRRWWSSSSSFTRLFLRHHRPESLFRVD